jgi:hypothetical protein
VLDEACAHAHAVAHYSPAAERLVLAGRAMRRGGAPRPRPAISPPPRDDAGDAEWDEGDPVQRMARDGMAALQRFGAELEALFGTPPVDLPPSGRAEGVADAARPADTPSAEPPRSLATLEAELRRRLVDEGIMVRGHDVARVVSLASGKRVTWVE